MKKRPNGKVQISLLIEPESSELLDEIARKMGLKRNDAFEVMIREFKREYHVDPHQLSRMESKLDHILEWL